MKRKRKRKRKRKKDHFAVYTRERKWFVVPLYYFYHPIFRVLVEMAEEFGTENHGPLQVPCEEELMDYILSLIRKNPSENVDKVTTCRGASLSSFLPLFYSILMAKVSAKLWSHES